LRIRFSSAARRDRREAEAFYRSASWQAFHGFRRDLQGALGYVVTYPEGAPIRAAEVRAKRCLHFPYTIFYRVHDGSIFILAIAHQARDPADYEIRFR
jgi:plasmid stabilization system protein ParE